MDTGVHTRIPHKHKNRDQGDAFTTQRMPEIASKPPEARTEAWNNPQKEQHLDLRLLPPEFQESVFLLFKLPSLWYFVMTVLAKLYS